jgi:hypothetical protein
MLMRTMKSRKALLTGPMADEMAYKMSSTFSCKGAPGVCACVHLCVCEWDGT